MNNIDSSRLLAEMSRMAQAAQMQSTTPVQVANHNDNPGDFNGLLMTALGKVNELQMQAGDLSDRLVQGDPAVSIAETMIAGQKSAIAFEAALQVRNKLINAYQDVMNMSI